MKTEKKGEGEMKTYRLWKRKGQWDTGAGRLGALRWIWGKTAPERQDNFSHFSVGGQRRTQGQRKTDSDKEREEWGGGAWQSDEKSRTAGDKRKCESEGGKRTGRDRNIFTGYAQMTNPTAARQKCVQVRECTHAWKFDKIQAKVIFAELKWKNVWIG